MDPVDLYEKHNRMHRNLIRLQIGFFPDLAEEPFKELTMYDYHGIRIIKTQVEHFGIGLNSTDLINCSVRSEIEG